MTDQTTTGNPPPILTTHTHLPGRVVGIVHSVKPRENGKVYIFLRGPDGTEYFSHISGWQTESEFKSAAVTQPVSFKVSITPNGKRAWDVRAPNAEEHALAATVVETIEDREAAMKANQVRNEELAEQSSKQRRLRTTRQESTDGD